MKSIIQLNADAIRFRQKVGYGNREPIDIESVVLQMDNYTVVKMDLSEQISGMCIVEADSNVIAINSSMSIGRQRFTLAHEIYHLEVEHLKEGKICPVGGYDSSDSEKEAEIFASFLLMPYDGLEWYIDKYEITAWNVRNVIGLSQFYKMSYMATLFRLIREHRITVKEFEELQRVNVRQEAIIYGYDIALYNASAEEERWLSLGEYPRLLEERKHVIPESLFDQFCREGFRKDMKSEYMQKGVMPND